MNPSYIIAVSLMDLAPPMDLSRLMLRHLFKTRILSVVAFSLLALLQTQVHAELTIEITGAGANRIPLAVADFGGEPGISRALTSVVRGDLERSGLFKMIDTTGAALTEASSPIYGDWKNRGADALAAGSISASGDGRQEARFRLYDVNKQNVLGGSAFVTSMPMLRAAGHRIADAIYEKLIGEPGGPRGVCGEAADPAHRIRPRRGRHGGRLLRRAD